NAPDPDPAIHEPFVSVSDRERHVRPPERELLVGDHYGPFGFLADAAEVSHTPVESDVLRQEAGRAAADVHRRQILGKAQRRKPLVTAHEHAAHPDYYVRANRVLREVPLHRESHVASEWRDPASTKQRL